ncbi:MAG TPA: hypothetical protein VE643_02705, partial [Nitrososphaeraceae archaeon]|nr:hypothetical protein [Nitrososphaeraceae archaeon]
YISFRIYIRKIRIDMANKIKSLEARVDFSFKREVFFIIAGGIVGALVMAIPLTFFPLRGYLVHMTLLG